MKQERAASSRASEPVNIAKDESSRTLLGMISHELRTPIQSILANVEVMSLMALPAEGQEALQRLERSVEVVLTRLDSISQFAVSSVNSEAEPGAIQEVDVREFMSSVVDELAAEAKRNDQTISIQIGGDVHTVEVDSTRLHQVLTNFVANAVRHGESGPITIRCAWIALKPSTHQALEISVTNASHRFPADGVDNLWPPFVRTSPGKSRPRGMGLGLAVVKLLADSVGWAVGCVRPTDEAVTFFVRLP